MPGATAIYGIVGEKIGYSLSPAIFAELFRRYRIDAIYQKFDIGKQQLAAFMIAARTVPLAGFNVTIPHKESVAKLVKDNDSVSAATGSVNLVLNKAGKLHGYNTDYAGIAASIEKQLRFDAAGANVVIVGSGGAARTVFYYLVKRNAASVRVLHHSQARARSFSTWANKISGESKYGSGMIATADSDVLEADLVINCTPVMVATLFKKKQVAAMKRVFELRYGGGTKPSKSYVSGEYMLAVQACEAFRMIAGIDITPEAVMRIVKKTAR